MTNKHLPVKGINADDAPHLVGPDEALNMENVRITDTGEVVSIKGTLPLNNHLPSGNNTRIGSCTDDARGFIIYAIYNDAGQHRISLFDPSNNFTYTVLQSEDVEGGLNFQKNKLVQMEVVGDTLKFLDSDGVPHSLNLGACIKGYGASPIAATWQFTYPIHADEILLIRRPPGLVPSLEKRTDAGTTLNQVGKESYQFAFQYLTYDGEPSVFSAWSVATKINRADDTYNYIRVQLNLGEKIPQNTRLVRLIVKRQSDSRCFIANEWDNMQNAYPLLQHNLGAALTFDFYGNLTGGQIDDADSVKPYDSVPLKSKSLAIAKNRLLLANNTEGYDTPSATSLQVAPQEAPISFSGGVNFQRNLWFLQHRDYNDGANKYVFEGYFIKLTEVSPQGYYLINTAVYANSSTDQWPLVEPTRPTGTLDVTALSFIGADLQTAVQNTRPAGRFYTNEVHESNTGALITLTGIQTNNSGVWKSGARGRAGVVFFDKALRKCGVTTNETLVWDIPYRSFDFTTGISVINWSLSNDARLQEIPAWANYYAIVRTLNLKTRFFVQGLDKAVTYWDKNTDGLWQTAGATYNQTRLAIGIDLRSLNVAGLGYTFNADDIVVLTDNAGVTTELPVKEVSGYTLLVQAKDLGDFTGRSYIFEIYTPHNATTQEPFFEVGEMYVISDPGTDDRAYSTVAGVLRPDTATLGRSYQNTGYGVEAMCPWDKFWQRRDTDAGRPNFVTSLGQAVLKGGISFSNTYVPGTQTNGLCSFEALNKEVLPVEGGEIMAITLTSKVQAEGNVLLALTRRGAFSVYLGEAMLSQADGSTFLAQSTGFIGQVNALQGDYGCSHPESLTLTDGRVFWFDMYTGTFVSYSNNGLFPISDYKLKTDTRDFARKLQSLSGATIESYGSRPFVFGGIDPYFGEALFSCPTTEPGKQYLDDYSDPLLAYPYSFYDGKGKIWRFGYNGDRWLGSNSFQSEGFVTVGHRLFDFWKGKLYEHNVSAPNVFHDQEPGKSSIMLASASQEPMAVWTNLIVEGTKPEFCHIRTEFPNTQSSDLIADDWTTREGNQYAAILRDRMSPNTAGDVFQKLMNGDPMRGPYCMLWLRWQDARVRSVSVTRKVSSGHPVG